LAQLAADHRAAQGMRRERPARRPKTIVATNMKLRMFGLSSTPPTANTQ
jgi:hypothetical protein